MKRIDLTGQRFGRFTAEMRAPDKITKSGNKIRFWAVLCDCGNRTYVQTCHLRSGASKQCTRCRDSNNCKLNGKISGKHFQHIQRSAAIRHIAIDPNVTREYLDELLKKQSYKCALSRLPIECSSWKDYGHTASLDRIDSKKPYQIGNIQWVHKHVNKMKGQLPIGEFVKICKEVTIWQERKQQLLANNTVM